MKNEIIENTNNLCAVQEIEWEKQTVKAFAFLADFCGSADKERLETLWAVAGNAALIAVSSVNNPTTQDAIQVLHTMNLEAIAKTAEKLKDVIDI